MDSVPGHQGTHAAYPQGLAALTELSTGALVLGTELTRTPPPLPFPAGRLVSGSPCRWASPISKTISPTSPQKGSMFQRKPESLLPQHSPCDLRQHKGRCLQTAPRSSLKPFPRKSVYIEQLRWGPKWHVFFDSSLFF